MNIIKKLIYRVTARVRNSKVSARAEVSYMCLFYWSKMEDYSYVSHHSSVFHTHIGKYTSIGAYCQIGGGEHPLKWVSTSPVFTTGRAFKEGKAELLFEPYKKTYIGNDVYIAANVIIKSGVKIEDGAVVGAGAVVTHDIPAYEIWAGNPAHKIGERFKPEIAQKLRNLKWWDWDEKRMRENAFLFNDVERFLEKNSSFNG